MLMGVSSDGMIVAVVVDVEGGSDAGVDAVDYASRHCVLEGAAAGTLRAV
jgi:hypothetical protein